MVCGKEMLLVTIRFNLVDPVVWGTLKWSEVKWKSLSHVQLFTIPWTIWSMEFARQEYWSGWQVNSLPAKPQGKPKIWSFQAPLSTEFPKPEYWSGYSLLHGSSQPRDWTQVYHIACGFFTVWAKSCIYLIWMSLP